MADIECFYKDYNLIVEVTLSSGQKQYEMEGEPVARHLGNHFKNTNKQSFCIFIAKNLNHATLAHFFYLHKVPISYYGGISRIVPMELSLFKKFIHRAYEATQKPKCNDLHRFLNKISDFSKIATNETDWYEFIAAESLNWT